MIIVSESSTSGLDVASVGSSLQSLRSLSQALLLAVGAINSVGVYHQRWTVEDVRVDVRGEYVLTGTLRNNVASLFSAAAGSISSASSSLADLCAHPVFLAPETLLAGPRAFDDPTVKPLLLRTDVYAVGILLLSILRGSLPLAAPTSEASAFKDDVFSPQTVTELWNIHFDSTGSYANTSSVSAAATKPHPDCALCNDDVSTPSHFSSADKSSTARLCLRCWLDLDNLSLDFPPAALLSSPLSLLASTVGKGTDALQAAYTSFLALLRTLLSSALDRPSAGEVVSGHAFFRGTAKWEERRREQAGVRDVWRKTGISGAASSGHPDTAAIDGLHSLSTDLHQVALDPVFRRSGFRGVQAMKKDGGGVGAGKQCQLCHQPLPAHLHPSSPAACHCLLPYSSDDLYAAWKASLSEERGQTVYQWLEEQTKKKDGAAAGATPTAVNRWTPLSSLPAALLQRDTVKALAGDHSANREKVNEKAPALFAFSAAPPSSSRTPSSSQSVYLVPLLPLYHLLLQTLHSERSAQLEKLWSELEVADAREESEKQQGETDAGSNGDESSSANRGRNTKIVRMKKSSSSESVISRSTQPQSALQRGLTALVRTRSLLRLYPATRRDLVQFVVDEQARWLDHAGGGKPWKVFASSSAWSAAFLLPSLRPALWCVLLSIDSRAKMSYALQLDCSLALLRAGEGEAGLDEQITKDVRRLDGLHDELDQLRLRRIIHLLLSNRTSLGYWQGLHSLAHAIFQVYPQPEEEHLAYAVLEKVMDLPFLSALHRPNNDAELRRQQDDLTRLLEEVDPEVSKALEGLQLSLHTFCIPWLLTAFTHVLKWESVSVLWDVLLTTAGQASLVEGGVKEQREADKATYRTWLLLTICALRLFRGVILSKSASFQSVLTELTHRVHTIDAREWVLMVLQMRRDIPQATWKALNL